MVRLLPERQEHHRTRARQQRERVDVVGADPHAPVQAGGGRAVRAVRHDDAERAGPRATTSPARTAASTGSTLDRRPSRVGHRHDAAARDRTGEGDRPGDGGERLRAGSRAQVDAAVARGPGLRRRLERPRDVGRAGEREPVGPGRRDGQARHRRAGRREHRHRQRDEPTTAPHPSARGARSGAGPSATGRQRAPAVGGRTCPHGSERRAPSPACAAWRRAGAIARCGRGRGRRRDAGRRSARVMTAMRRW